MGYHYVVKNTTYCTYDDLYVEVYVRVVGTYGIVVLRVLLQNTNGFLKIQNWAEQTN